MSKDVSNLKEQAGILADRLFKDHSGYLIEQQKDGDYFVWVWRYSKQGKIMVRGIPDGLSNEETIEMVNVIIRLNDHAERIDHIFGWDMDDFRNMIISCKLTFQFK